MSSQPSLARAWVWTVLLVAILECAHPPTKLLLRDLPGTVGLLGLSTLAALVVATLAAMTARLAKLAGSQEAAIEGLVAAALAYAPLLYEPYVATAPPMIAATLTFAAGVALLRKTANERWPEGSRRAAAMVFALALVAHAINLFVKPGLNPAFHLWAWFITGFVVWLGLRLLPPGPPSKASFGGLLLLLAASGLSVNSMHAQGLFRSYLSLGRALVFFEADAAVDPGVPMEFEPLDSQAGWATFDELADLPPPPPTAGVVGKNFLVIHVDATRYDLTSLGDPANDRTPRLRELAQRDGSYTFSDAHAPCTGTFQSSIAGFAARPISTVHVSVGGKDWFGKLHETDPLLPDVLRKAGYRTSWVGHNHRRVFETGMLGLTERFEFTDLVAHEASEPEADLQIVQKTLAELDAAAADPRPFFLWAFLVSPHYAYAQHYPDQPARSELDRYKQELQFADERVGEILDGLEARGLADDTVIILSSDHGEEFGEHGWLYHGRHAHQEARHVPLIVNVPGSPGASSDAPVSTVYLWPWLLGRRAQETDSFFDASVREGIAPYLRITNGAVLTEHLGLQNMQSALVYRDHSVTYNFHGRRVQVFDRVADRFETNDLSRSDQPWVLELLETMQRYRALRRTLRRFDLEGSGYHNHG